MVAHGPLVGGRRLGGADVHAAVHLHRVDGDDLRAGDGAGRGHGHVGLPDAVGPRTTTGAAAMSERGDGDARAVRGLGDEVDEAAREVVRRGARDLDRGVRAGTQPARGGAKCTSRWCGVRAASTVGSFLLGPSTRTSSTRPTRASLAASALRSITMRRRPNRSPATSGSTKRSAIVAASVPGRGEKMNVNASSNRAAEATSIVCSKSSAIRNVEVDEPGGRKRIANSSSHRVSSSIVVRMAWVLTREVGVPDGGGPAERG